MEYGPECIPEAVKYRWDVNSDGKVVSKGKKILTSTLSAWPLRGHTALKSILGETLFLNQLHDLSLLSLNSFLHPFLKSKFMKKFLSTKKISFSKPDYSL